ncbi:MAG: hypothetical protein K8S54_19595 [Spirochaetia bacterium]|nr:hypothetical protein [Spirochaetia bacterium]
MIRSLLTLILVSLVTFINLKTVQNFDNLWKILPHVILGAGSVLGFDAMRYHYSVKNPLRAVSIASLGTFVRVVMLGIYGTIHMFFATPDTLPALGAFLSSLLACLFFGVAWETGSSILSHRK